MQIEHHQPRKGARSGCLVRWEPGAQMRRKLSIRVPLDDFIAPLATENQVTTSRRRPAVDCLVHSCSRAALGSGQRWLSKDIGYVGLSDRAIDQRVQDVALDDVVFGPAHHFHLATSRVA